MGKITRIGFIGIWICELIFLPLSQMPWLLGVSLQGWPDVKVTEIAQHNEGYLMKVIFLNMLVSNLPDYFSIVLYVKMYMKSKTAIEPEIEMQNQLAYGGIWVGEDALPVHQPTHHIDAHIQATNNQQQDKMRSILKFLRWNVLLCLVDLLSPIVWNQLICEGIYAIILCYTFTNVTCYFIPMLILGVNFKKFKRFWTCNQNA